MYLSGQNIKHISTCTHEGKVVVLGIDESGAAYYTVRQTGFEDTALQDTDNTTGFERWKALILDGSLYDASIDEYERTELCDGNEARLLTSRYGRKKDASADDSVIKSALAPVQLVSGLGHLCVFRMAQSGKILCNRFVLDGIKNELVPKLEVRFRRSRQKLQPDMGDESKRSAGRGPAQVDSLDFRDIDDVPFHEPAIELSFIRNTSTDKPWFSAFLLPTMEHEQSRWNVFVYDTSTSNLVLYSVRASSEGLFDLKDTTMVMPDPARPDSKVLRQVPGIIKRTIDLQGLSVADGFAAQVYHTQRESVTRDGSMQLLKGSTRVMLTVPVTATGQTTRQTAAIDFAVAVDGTLSQIDKVPTSAILRSKSVDVLLPLDTLDEIKGIADSEPAPAGAIQKMAKGSEDRLRVYSTEPVSNLGAGERVRVRGTKSYDGHYEVSNVDEEGFEIQAVFQNDEQGFWEMVEDEDTGLVFDNMVVACEKTADGKLRVLCESHDLQEGDEIQVTGTRGYDGIHPVMSVAEDNSFLLDIDWQAGEAVNLNTVKRRGIRFDGEGDYLRTPALALNTAGLSSPLGRTLSAWVWVDENRTQTELIASQEDGGIELYFDSDGKVVFRVRFSDGSVREVKDTELPLADSWHHFAGVVDYSNESGVTTLYLCRNGVQVTPVADADETVSDNTKKVAALAPPHLGNSLPNFDNSDDFISFPSPFGATPGDAITLEAWAYLDPSVGASSARCIVTEMYPGSDSKIRFALYLDSAAHTLYVGFYSGGWQRVAAPDSFPTDRWVHVAGSYDGHYIRLYVNGQEVATSGDLALSLSSGTDDWRIGRRWDSGADANKLWHGHIADVRIWNRTRSAQEIKDSMYVRLTGREADLLAYWPLDGEARDLSASALSATVHGAMQWTDTAWRYPLADRNESFVFDGNQDAVIIGDFAHMPSEKISISFWIKTTSSKTLPTPFSYATSSSNNNAFSLYDAKDFYLGINEIFSSRTGVSVNDGVWHHVVATWESETGTFILYKDGKEVSRQTDYAKGQVVSAGGALAFAQEQDSVGGSFDVNQALDGSLSQVAIWSDVLSAEQVRALVKRRLSGTEPNLVGAWLFDEGRARDISSNQSHGTFLGAPVRADDPDELVPKRRELGLYIGGDGSARYFAGKISDVQIWNRARPAEEIKDTMHLRLAGTELDLAGNWRMGGIARQDNGERICPDFCTMGNDARVHGDAYVSARELPRAIGAGKVVMYRNDDLYAVSQGGTYREQFEFRAVRPDGTFLTLDELNNADGTGYPIFAFSYWGKRSRGSKETIKFPSYAMQVDDFIDIGNGWHRAACRFTVPDGVAMVRAFELSPVKGLWQSQTSAPANEWDRLEVRKHRIQLISDSVTQETFADSTTLSTLADPQQSVSLDQLQVDENAIAVHQAEIARLLERIDVVNNNDKYISERDTLSTQLSQVRSERSTAQSDRTSVKNDPANYTCRVRGKNSGRYLHAKAWSTGAWFWKKHHRNITTWSWVNQNNLKWRFIEYSGGYYRIRDLNNRYLHAQGTSNGSNVTWSDYDSSDYQLWKLEYRWGGYYAIRNKAGNRVLDVYGNSTGNDANIILWSLHGGGNQLWYIDKKWILSSAQSRVDSLDRTIARSDREIARIDKRLRDLNAWLSGTESLSTLQSQLATARQNLTDAQNDFNTRNNTLLSTITQNQQTAQTMPALHTDTRELVTRGAVLGFARPSGSVELTSSCEGNLLLSYIDERACMRMTRYDATADSRNAQFEQWIPDSLRPCLEFRDSGDMLTLGNPSEPMELAANNWTVETWFHYPGASQSDGTLYDYNVLFDAKDRNDHVIAIKQAERLGTVIDGFFHDSGYNLEVELAHGWHHLTAVGKNGATHFYIDGEPVGRPTSSKKYVVTFDGQNDYLHCANFQRFPSSSFTLGMWLRLETSKNTIYPLSYATSSQDNALWLSGKDLRIGIMNSACDVTGININDGRWHHVAVTWQSSDGTLKIYKDGIEAFNQIGFCTNTTIPGGGTLVLGQEQDSLGGGFDVNQAFDGELSGLSIWDRVRSESEIKEDMYRVLSGEESGLVSYWSMEPFDENDEKKLRDLMATNPNHFIIGGEPVSDLLSGQCTSDISYIGNARGSGSPAGKMAEVRVWNAALTDEEIATNSKLAITGCEPELVAWYPMNEGTGTEVRDNAVGEPRHGTSSGAEWVMCTAPMGATQCQVVSFDGTNDHITFPSPFDNRSGDAITAEAWVYLDASAGSSDHRCIVTETYPGSDSKIRFVLYVNTASHTIYAGFYDGGWRRVSYNSLPTDTWVHLAGTYDGHHVRLYKDGVQEAVSSDFNRSLPVGSDEWRIGRRWDGGLEAAKLWKGHIAEVRLWNCARTVEEIAAYKNRRLDGTEANLAAYFRLDGTHDGKVIDLGSRECHGDLQGAKATRALGLPIASTDRLVVAEYDTITPDAEDHTKRVAMMRRFAGFTAAGELRVVSDQRIEHIELKWIGNAQFQPTLLGYIETPPPVPCENLTVNYDYDGAAYVQLTQNDDVEYSWTRSQDTSQGLDLSLFLGAGWGVSGGLGIESKISEGRAGFRGSLNLRQGVNKSSTVRARSSNVLTDRLELRGNFETKPQMPHLGNRYVPKNVGYALVVSGLADVFVTRLKRSGRMVSYQMLPVEGVPLDVNTITFLVNPAYTRNGSLDGLVGSQPADERFYSHVPEMRAQYGSLYPASFMRLEQAYDLKSQIERQDAEREAYFINFDATNASEGSLTSQTADASEYDSYGQVDVEDESESGGGEDDSGAAARKEQSEKAEQDKQREEEKSAQRKDDIDKKHQGLEKRVEASAGFDGWQKRMENLQIRAAKRNIVNTYVWDADGGMRSEEQSFVNTVEHTVGGSFSISGTMGLELDLLVGGFKMDLSALYAGEMTQTMSKTRTGSRGFELDVYLDSIESKGITDADDYPMQPGEKVDRYRFMSFFLEGSTSHFHDFFNQVVDPEWLISNDEEARALREAMAGRPNKAWRVLHRVTYVERPALMGFGRDLRKTDTVEQAAEEVLNYFDALEQDNDAVKGEIGQLKNQLNQISTKLDQLLNQ